jgi:hypothetical protein
VLVDWLAVLLKLFCSGCAASWAMQAQDMQAQAMQAQASGTHLVNYRRKRYHCRDANHRIDDTYTQQNNQTCHDEWKHC